MVTHLSSTHHSIPLLMELFLCFLNAMLCHIHILIYKILRIYIHKVHIYVSLEVQKVVNEV